jgi:hypothetical protein
MNRRGFFRGLAATALLPLAVKLAPILPAAVNRRINSLLTTTEIINEALRVLHANTNFIAGIDRNYDVALFGRDQWTEAERATLRIRMPVKYQINKIG